MIEIRDARPDDEPFLWEMLGHAAAWRDDDPLPIDELRAAPDLAHYVAGWAQAGDLGVVALDDGEPVGAAWLRTLGADDPGYGFVAADVPELAMGVDPRARDAGVGSALLDTLLDRAWAVGLPGVSLSVEEENERARWLYETRGFAGVGRVDASDTLALSFATPDPGGVPDRRPHLVVGVVGTTHPRHEEHLAAIRAHALADVGAIVPLPAVVPGDGPEAGFDGLTEAAIARVAMDSDVVVLDGDVAGRLAALRLVAGPGCAVFVEPPLAATAREAEAFAELVDGAGIACATGLREPAGPDPQPFGAALSAFLDRIAGRPHPPLSDAWDALDALDTLGTTDTP